MTPSPQQEQPRLSRAVRAVRGRPDILAVALILALTAIAEWRLLYGGTMVGMDAATQFYPWYSYLGERLSSGEIPGWNPHLLSGEPFAASPLSGWSYLPAMVLFTLLPLVAAAKAYMVLHLLLAGLSAYALGRTLGLGTAGSLLAATAYEFSGYLYVRHTCCLAYSGVLAWLPLAILGLELALRSRSWLPRFLWWSLCGLAVSQILASWLGQGSYYALLALGGYVAYRTLVSPPPEVRGLRGRLSGAALHGGAVLLLGFGLAAAGLLPRLEYNALTNLAGGYPDIDPDNGLPVERWGRIFMLNGYVYAGAAVAALALAGPLLARWRFSAPYFAALSLGALVLALPEDTLLHSALYLLPGFEQLHPHAPERALIVFYLGAALLAGAALTVLLERGGRDHLLLAPPAFAVLYLAATEPADAPEGIPMLGISMPPLLLLSQALVLALAAAGALLPRRFFLLRGGAVVLLVLVVFVELLAAGQDTFERHADSEGRERLQKVDLAAYYEATPATRFLQSAGEEPSRYLGYSPEFDDKGRPVTYNYRFTDPDVRALEAENRAILHENLYSLHGYTAPHLARYEEYVQTMNDRPQGYHNLDVFSAGLQSPLLDLLNVRHVVGPADDPPASFQSLQSDYPTVHEDERVSIVENTDALPRAWVVHSARQAGQEEALELLDSGEVDPREAALLEEEPPPLEEPGDSGSRAAVERFEADRIEVGVETDAPGLLVLSEVYYPAWKAYVDGEPVPIHRANHLLRAVPVPAGEHTVELRYESWTLRAGTAISATFATAILAVAVAAWLRRPRRDSEKAPPGAGR